MTTTTDVDVVEIPLARVLPQRPPTFRDQLVAAIEGVEMFLVDSYEHGRVQDPGVVMLAGMRDAFVLVLGWLQRDTMTT